MASKAKESALQKALANLGASRKPTAATSVDLTSDEDMSFAVLPIGEIEPYHYNPRTSRNPRYDELFESIKADGITNMLTVTRRDRGSKYTTYGGGNTRLMIAKELYAAGDKRFASLQVVVKAWPGDAQIILAQLAENENRADISFWEKANGVERFRQEFEREAGKALSANGLHTELKKRGISYSSKTLQNFAFCIENLQTIGPWLRAADVNEVIRPAYLLLLRLSQKLHKDTQVPEAFESVLQKHASLLSKVPPEQQELDSGELVADWQTAFAEMLAVSSEHLRIMLDALKDNSNISAQALRAACVPSEPEPMDADYDEDSDLGEDDARHEQPAKGTSARAGRELSTTARDTLTPKGSTAGFAEHGDKGADRLHAEILSILKSINEVTPLHDVIREDSRMPFGFFVDFPESSMATIGGKPASNPHLRAAMWKLLVAVSGQLDRRIADHLPEDDGGTSYRFSRDLAQDADTFRAAFEKHGVTLDEKNNPQMMLSEIAMLFADPQLPHHIIRLLDAIEQVRISASSDAPDGFQALFNAHS